MKYVDISGKGFGQQDGNNYQDHSNTFSTCGQMGRQATMTQWMKFLLALALFILEKCITAKYVHGHQGVNISYKSWTTYTGNRMKKYRFSGKL